MPQTIGTIHSDEMLRCCGEKKYNQYLQTCIIWDKSYRNASGGRVCVRGQTKRRAH